MDLGKTLCAATLMLASAGAMAQGPNYNYVQGGYQMVTGGDNPDGLFIDASFQVADQIYVAGGYDYFGESGYDLSVLSVRGGYFHPLEQNIHVYGEAGLARSRVEVKIPPFGTVSDTSTDLMFEGGVRARLMPALEVRGALRVMTGDYDETFLIGEGAYQLNQQWSAVAGLAHMSDASEFRFQMGARFAF